VDTLQRCETEKSSTAINLNCTNTVVVIGTLCNFCSST